MKKAFLSVLLVTVLCLGLSLLPTAAEGETVGAPEGIGAPELPIPTIPADNWLDYAEAVEEKDDVYEITKAEQLAWIAKQTVMLKTDFSGKTLKLMNDIDLSKHLWTPIGHKDMAFKGSFDGQNHTVKGLIITDDANAGDYVGLFGYVYGGLLQNVTLTDAYLKVSSSSSLYVGTLVGDADDSSITNCSVSNATVSGSSSFCHVGGVAGSASSITNCSVSSASVRGTASSNCHVGGVAGSASSITNCNVSCVSVSGTTTYSCYAGGAAGSAHSITNCSVSDVSVSVTASSDSTLCYVGGVAGYAKYSIVNSSVSDVSVSVTASSSSSSSYDSTLCYVGGVAGYASSITYCSVSNTTVNGTASTSSNNYNCYVGGVAGYANSSIRNCSVSSVSVSGSAFSPSASNCRIGGLCGYADGSISNSFAVVSLSSKNDTSGIGGLVGENSATITNCYAHVTTDLPWYGIAYTNSTTVTNCYYNNSAAAAFKENTGRAFDCKVMTDDEMKADAFVSALNGYWDDVTDEIKYKYWSKDTANANGGFPILTIPKITSLEVVAPSFKGGTIQFRFHGENLDKAGNVTVSRYSSSDYFTDTAVVDPTLITASYTPYNWSETEEGYTYSGTAYLTLDGVETSYSYTALIPLEAKTPKVTSLSYTDTLSSAGGVVDVTLIGENLSDFDDTLTLTASSSLTTVRTTEVERVGDTLCVLLPLPANVGRSDIRYSLSVSLGSTSQSLSTSYTVTVKAPTPTEENSPLDLNGDGHVNVMDVIYLIGRITAMVS